MDWYTTGSLCLQPPIFIVLSICVGLILGSFYTVCIHRYHTRQSIITPRSHCPRCTAPLRWYTMIPVLSYLLLRGRCTACGQSIPIMYPLVELISGTMAGLLAWRYGASGAFCVYLVFTGLLIVASGIDIRSFILPDGITLGGTVLAIPAAIGVLHLPWQTSLIGAALGGGVFWMILFVFKRLRGMDGMGLGDVKLMLLLGALFGPLYLPLITFTAGISGLCATLLFFIRHPKRRKTMYTMPIPLGPFLTLGAFITMIAGQDILRWWLL